ncbi:MAG TPA: response regulator transcription factor [Actinomycetota bacterium]|nr:response regulator transcription factor [Actinomycetota bacterium]
MTTVLVIDDEHQILRALSAGLGAQGYEVLTASTGEAGLDMIATAVPDCVILDLRLPDIDGTEVLRRLRAWSEVPVIVLSVRDSGSQKVDALDAGADDYVNKPFAMDELLARMRAMLRRVKPSERAPAVLRFGELEVDLERALVRRGDQPIRLTPTEYALLQAFVANPDKLLTHSWLLRQVWGRGYGEESHYLRIYVRQLRRKIGDEAADPRYIATEPGMGYRWIHRPDIENEGALGS